MLHPTFRSMDITDRNQLSNIHAIARQSGADQVDVDVLISTAMSALRQQSFENAHTILQAALVVDPDAAQAWSLMGMVSERLERDDDAKTAYETALGLDEDDPVTAMALATLYAKKGLRDEASALLNWLLGASDDAPEISARASALRSTLVGEA